jgi:hypothetical protein
MKGKKAGARLRQSKKQDLTLDPDLTKSNASL